MKTPTETARERFAGKRVVVVGLAREGVSLVRFLAGVGAAVTANDHATADSLAPALALLDEVPVRFVLGEHPAELFTNSDFVFVSPGVPLQMSPLVEAEKLGVPISSETQLFFELCPGSMVGITGSSGKTTTTTLVGEMLRTAGFPTHVGGNIGVPLLERLDQIGPEEWVVLEMSSFQLERLPYSPRIATILNITPNHLDRHSDMESYVTAKANILRHQRPGDRAVLNADDVVTAGLSTVEPPIWFSLEHPVDGSYLEGDRIVLGGGVTATTVCRVTDVRLRGRHNLSNVVAAVAVASAAGVPTGAMAAVISRFRGVPHRLEIVSEINGVTYCNDSIATAPERSMASIRSFDEPVILIAGGRDKHLPMDEWAELIRRRVRALVLLGESSDLIERAVLAAPGPAAPPIYRAGSMEEAVGLASRVALPGDVVLLAPGGTSFDMFKDFEERGERFVGLVRELEDQRH